MAPQKVVPAGLTLKTVQVIYIWGGIVAGPVACGRMELVNIGIEFDTRRSTNSIA
jgi:hypothetical protein